MSNRPSIKRLSIIVETLSGRYPPALQTLLDALRRQGFEISKRTLQRDIECLRTDFGLDILYNTTTNTYEINTSNSLYFKSFLRMAQLFNTSELLLQSIREKEKINAYVAFENYNETCAGLQYFELLYTAIRDCRQISFDHENFSTGLITKYIVYPFLLKEYERKWYVIGAIPQLIEKESRRKKTTADALHVTQYVRTFGLDRIANLKIEQATFAPAANKVIQNIFADTIGLVYHTTPPETVTLAVNAGQAKYFKRVPLHHSQIIISENKNTVVFSYFLVPNIELQRILLSYGGDIVVLQPAWFKQQVLNEIKLLEKKYLAAAKKHKTL